MKKKMKNAKGITLLALVITIVILIILATISINWIFGDNGLVNRTEQAKFEHSKAEARERLSLVLADAYVEKNVTQEYTEDEFLYEHLEDFVYGQEPGAKIFEYGDGEVISLNGHSFWLDRSVPQLGDYLGEEGILPPVITRINILDKTTSSVNIEVLTTESDGLKYKYAIKELGQGDESYTQETEKSQNTNEFTGLQENTIYTVKVELIKDGEIVNTKNINIVIGIMEKGVVRFDEIVWKNGQASVKIITDETDYTLQYQIGGIDDNSWKNTTSGSIIGGLEYGQTVYGRLWSEYGESDPASCDVVDKISPIVTVIPNGTNTNSISVNVQAVDNESGMADSVTYKYLVKESSQPDGSYEEKGSNTAGKYSITGLTQGTSYDVKVEVTGDKAGNIGIGYLQNQTTGTLPGGEEGVEQGAITFGKTTWSSGQASITINTNTDLQLQYQKNSTSGSWTDIENGGTVTGLANNNTVYARLTDGTNYGEYASATIVDEIEPTITKFEATEIKGTKITVQVEAVDNESGLATSDTYKFYLNDEQTAKGTNTNGTFIYTGLNGLTDYKLRAEVYDSVGNKKESTINVTTKEATVEEAFDISENQKIYVEYPNVKNLQETILCNVLYNDNKYGMQIISVNSLENIFIGYTSASTTKREKFNELCVRFNEYLSILNNKAMEYNNDKYSSDARCVGSLPNNKNFDDSYENENNKNYFIDTNQMQKLGIIKSNNVYYLASKFAGYKKEQSNLYRRDIYIYDNSKSVYESTVCSIVSNTSSIYSMKNHNYGLRPVFTLKPEIKITGGNGTEDSPYTLGV